jgi:hypothetical protein
MKNKLMYLAAVSAATFGTAAHAVDDTQITESFASANTSYGLVIAGIITLVALGTGLGMIVSGLRK